MEVALENTRVAEATASEGAADPDADRTRRIGRRRPVSNGAASTALNRSPRTQFALPAELSVACRFVIGDRRSEIRD